MKKMIRTIFVVIALLSITPEARSQNSGYVSENTYTNAVGFRLGTDNGITFKHFYKPTWAFEIQGTTGYRAIVATALIEKHYEIANTRGLNLFFGGGLHAGSGHYVAYYRHTNGDTYIDRTYTPQPSAGVDGIFGIEYKIPEAPFTIGMDLKPYVDVFYPGESAVEGAFSFRYAFQ